MLFEILFLVLFIVGLVFLFVRLLSIEKNQFKILYYLKAIYLIYERKEEKEKNKKD